jgi:hypothetical protein
MKQHDMDPFSTRVKELLDEKADNLDAATQSRLRQARMRALDSAPKRPEWLVWGPASAVAAGLMAVGIYLNQAQPPLPAIYQEPEQQTVAENMDLLDDLEFVAWLALEERT